MCFYLHILYSSNNALLESLKVRKEISVYHTLNMLSFDVTKKCLVAEGWSPVFASKQVIIFSSFPLQISRGNHFGLAEVLVHL